MRWLQRSSLSFVCLSLLLSWLPWFSAEAHEGESHGEEPVVKTQLGNIQSHGAVTEDFEVVLKYAPLKPNQEGDLKIYLSDFATNEPIGGAKVEISMIGSENSQFDAKADKVPGIYNTKIKLAKAQPFDLLVEINTKDKSDLVAFNGLLLGTDESSTGNVDARKKRPVLILFGVLGVLVLVIFSFWLGKRSGKAAEIGLLLLAIIISLQIYRAEAHEGESHGNEPPANTQQAGNLIYISKESQFLLGLRTTLVAEKTLSKTVSVLGKIVPVLNNMASVYTPQAGRIVPDSSYTIPSLGENVGKGQVLAAVQILDQIFLRAPISGTVTEINFTPGEQVEQGRKLMTIIDLHKVWVQANLFEEDFALLRGGKPAQILSDAYPNRIYTGNLVSYGKTIDPMTRSLPVTYAVSNSQEELKIGMLVNVEINTGSEYNTLAVPSSTVLDFEGSKVVFVHTSPEIFMMRPVEVGGYYGNLVSLKAGVVAGDRVVVTGGYQLLTAPRIATAQGLR